MIKKGTDVVSVIHRKGDAIALEIIHVLRDWFVTAFGCKYQLEPSRARCQEVCRVTLIAKRVAADDDGLDPSGDGSRNTLEDDWLAEDGAAEDVADLGTRKSHTREKARWPNEIWEKGVYGSEVRMVPLGERHIYFNLNFFMRSSSAVMVAHLISTSYLRIVSTDSTVT